MINSNKDSSRPWEKIIIGKFANISVQSEKASQKAPGKQSNEQPAEFDVSAVQIAKEAEARARQASKLANEVAIRAKESVLRSALATRELALEAKRKARAAQLAALKAKSEAKVAARVANRAKKTQAQTSLDRTTEQTQPDPTWQPEPGSKLRLAKEEPQKEADLVPNAISTDLAACASPGTKRSSSEMLEGRVNVVLLKHPNPQQIHRLTEELLSVKNISVIVSGSIEEGSRLVIHADQPVPLIDVLNRISVVDEVTQFGWREIQLSLKE